MTREEAKIIAKSLMMDIGDEAVTSIVEKHKEFMEKIDLLKAIDTTGILPMDRVDESETLFLREDVAGEVLPTESIIKNAPESRNNFVVIAKVVK